MAESELSALAAQLQQRQKEYRLCEPLAGTEAQFEFIGRFDGVAVIWQARLLALGSGEREQFIEIGPAVGERRQLTVGLALERVTPPDILKTVIMIRNYKRLREGRHEWQA
ncbi:hypothetical protein [Thiohalobacter thiocyanaticus]|uniref:Uncharacterized protein n=1 Tax=Thiohalobacter thiocyanaticus TaxID=585455 RepID=A0A426QJS5_9GAMM|nr:hypothetical protein [Thiohalobacter thiocyanaticus]RRQ22021.1 hypothetical protein D6C00_08715 [Thiohalobacter thiocyanaticus]